MIGYYRHNMRVFLPALFAAFFAAGAQAQAPVPTPVPATLENLVNAAIRVGAITLDDDRMVDDYARIAHCDLFTRLSGDEFTWRDVRKAIRQSVAQNKASFPVSFYLFRTETFGQYDFSSHTLPLTGTAIMRRTAYLEMLRLDPAQNKICNSSLQVLPGTFVAVLDKPLQMDAILLKEDLAARVIRIFDKNPAGRIAYGRYLVSLHNGSIDNLRGDRRIDFAAHLDNIEFAVDPSFEGIFWSGIDTPIISKGPTYYNSPLSEIPFKGIGGTDTKSDDTAPFPAEPALPASPEATAP